MARNHNFNLSISHGGHQCRAAQVMCNDTFPDVIKAIIRNSS
jgi:hypothetical protein